MLKNNRPYTNENGWTDDKLITSRSEEDIKQIKEWIGKNIIKVKTVCTRCSSYGLKHVLEDDIKIYLTNNEFKDAMLLCGYEPVDPSRLNWQYRISLKSPAVKRV